MASINYLDLRTDEDREAYDAVALVFRRLNGGRGLEGVKAALNDEHSTLLGLLANEVLEAASVREHDGRLCDLNAPLSELAERLPGQRFSFVRQRYI